MILSTVQYRIEILTSLQFREGLISMNRNSTFLKVEVIVLCLM